MANSDNVLRGGLTSKHVDLPELFGVLDFTPFKPEILCGREVSPSCFRYETPAREFSLFVLKGPQAVLEETGPAIITVTRGSVEVENYKFAKGESAYIPRRKAGETLRFGGGQNPGGEFTLFAALSPV
jgi:mannose-6-phosphate isomerase